MYIALEDPRGFKRLPHPSLSKPSASALAGPAPQGHRQSLVNDNPSVYVALGRGDREQGGKQGGGTSPALASLGLPFITGPATSAWSGSTTFLLCDVGQMT